MKDLIRTLVTSKLKASGFSSFAARSLFEHWWEDFRREKRTTLGQKLWAYRRGFLSGRILYYGLTGENYRDYISDYDYMLLHPINGPYSKWIDEKLTIRYILAPFAEYLPEYYFHLYRGEVLPLPDCPGCEGSIQGEVLTGSPKSCPTLAGSQGVLNLLQQKGALAAKLAAGTKGHGFHKLEYRNQAYLIDRQPASEDDMRALLTGWLASKKTEYLLTGYLQQHSSLDKIWPEAPGALRMMVVRQRGQAPHLALAFHHFATSKTGVLNTPGGVSCIVDVRTGFFSNGQSHSPAGLIDTPNHPDTGLRLEGYLPNWPLISEKIIEISSYLPQLRYLGFDVVITEEGFKVIEINSHAGLDYLQTNHPVLGYELTRDFFTELLAEKKHK